MFRGVLFLLLFVCLPAYAQNATRVTSQAQHPYRHHANDLSATDTPSDGECATYDSSTGLFEWAACDTSGNVGIGTTNRVVFQIGTTTTGTPYNINGDTNGNLGIGSASPGTALDVTGAIRASGNITGANLSGTNTGDQSLAVAGGWTDGTDIVYTTVSTDNVGIGTSVITTKLAVTGSVSDFGIDLDGRASANGYDSNTKLLLHMDDTSLTDSSPIPQTTNPSGASRSSAQSVFGGFSALFVRASTQYVSVADFAAGNLGSNDFNIFTRVRYVSIPGFTTFIAQYGGAGNRAWDFKANATSLAFEYSSDGTSGTTPSVSWTPSTNTWYALQISRNGNNLWFCVDGSQLGATQDVTGLTIFNSTANICIGGDGAACNGNNIDAYQDEMKVDIGTTLAVGTCTVSSTAFGPAVNQPRIKFLDDGTTTWSMTSDGNDSDKLKLSNGTVGTNDRVTVQTDGNVGVGTTTPYGKLIVHEGNVGINSIAPGQVLDVAGNIRSRGVNSHFFGDDNKASISASATTTPDIRFLTNSSEAMRITTGGFVGIGTTAPAGDLHVFQTSSGATVNGTADAIILECGSSCGMSILAPGATSVARFMFGDEANSAVGRLEYDLRTDNMNFYTGGGEQMRIDSNGNIGINSTGPRALLDITSTANQNLFMVQDNGAADASPFIIAADGNVGVGTTNASAKLHINTSTNHILFQDTAGGNTWYQYMTGGVGKLRFYRGTDKVVFDNTGNVGIGTIDPHSLLTVTGGGVGVGTNVNSAFIQTAAPNGNLLVESNVGIATTAPGGRLELVGIGTHVTSGANLIIRNSNNTTSLTSRDSGMFQLNTSTGVASVDVVLGGFAFAGASMNGGSAKYGPVIKFGSTDPQLTTTNPKYLAAIAGYATETYNSDDDSGMGLEFFTTPDGAGVAPLLSSRMIINQNGNVGIGTGNARSILDIDEGTGTAQVTIYGTTGGCLMIQDTDGAGWTECDVLDGVMSCSTDADGICD